MPSSVILGTARTPFGKMGGSLSSLDATDLGGHAIEAALERSGVDPAQVQQVVFGQVLQAGQGQIPSRQAQIKGGIPKEVPSETINKVCASGMRALGIADQAIRAGDTRGRRHRRHGVDEPGPLPAAGRPLRLPHGRRHRARRDDPRRPHQPLHRQADDQRGQRGLQRAGDHPRRHGPLRRALAPARRRGDRRRPPRRRDRRRHRQVAQGREHGRGRRGDPARHDAGDARQAEGDRRRGRHPHRRQRARGQRRRRRDRRRLLGVGRARRHARRWPASSPTGPSPTTSPTWRGRPANAAKQALEKIGKSPEDVDLWEINEAFASVALNSVRMLGVDEEKVNVNGGAIALGHPIGASGARIVGALVHELGRRGGGLGVAAICSGGGQGDAIVLEVPRGLGLSRAAAFFDLDKTLMAGSSGMQFARVAAQHGIVSRRQLASWGFEHLRYRLRGTTDERTGEVLQVARELIRGVAGEDDRADGAGGDGGDPAAGLPADARGGPRPPGRRSPDLHRQRRRQRRRRVAGPGAGDGGRHRHPLRGRRRGQLHRPPRRALRLRARQGRGDGGLRRRATRSTSTSPTPTPTRSRTCRCCARSATRSRSTPTRRWPRSPSRRAGRRCASSASAAACSPSAVTLLATVAGLGASRYAARRT